MYWDQVLTGWTTATPKILENQIRISMGRNQIENVLFTFKSLKKLNATQQKMYTEFDYFGERDEGKDAFLKVKDEYEQYKTRYQEQGKTAWEMFNLLEKEESMSVVDALNTYREEK